MPEEIEIPTEHLHEQIEEKAEEKRERWILYLALSTAFMAVLAAFAGLLAGHHANEALVERMKASDQWNFYQAKNLKEEIASNTDLVLKAVAATFPAASTQQASHLTTAPSGQPANHPSDAASGQPASHPTTTSPQPSAAEDHSKDIARYETEKQEIKKIAEEDEQASEAHLAKHVPLSRAVTGFQIAIAISAIAVLTRRRILWYAGLVLTAAGILFLIIGILP